MHSRMVLDIKKACYCQPMAIGCTGNFGIVTRYTVATVAVPAQVTFINLVWPASAAAPAVQWYLVRASLSYMTFDPRTPSAWLVPWQSANIRDHCSHSTKSSTFC